MANRKAGRRHPIYRMTSFENGGVTKVLHIHFRDSFRTNNYGRLRSVNGNNPRIVSPETIYELDQDVLAGKIRKVYVYGSWIADNGKTYENAVATELEYDPSTGMYGWDMLMEQVRDLGPDTNQSAPVEEKIEEKKIEEKKEGRTVLEW